MDVYLLFFIISLVMILVLIYLFLKQNNNLKDSEMELAVLKTKYDLEIKNSEEKFQILQEAKENLSLEFKNLANKIFEDKAKQFSTTSKEQFNEELKDRILLKDELYDSNRLMLNFHKMRLTLQML